MRAPPAPVAFRRGSLAFRLLPSAILAAALVLPSSVLATDRPPDAPLPPTDAELGRAASLELEPPEVALPPIDAAIERIIAHAQTMPAQTWDLEWLAEDLMLDGPIGAFEWVRDHIRYEPYQGVLRGPQGTLAARAGNSADQALLLAALLERQLVDVEFAFGEADEVAVDRLLEASLAGPALRIDETFPAERFDVEGIGARAQRDFAVLRSALEPTGALTGGVDEELARADARSHTWLRIPYGTGTLDLDPTLPEHEAGDRLTETASTSPEIPDQLRHMVRLEVVLEELQGERLSEQVVLDERLDAVAASEARMFLLFEPDLSGFAGAIEQVLSGDERWTPVLLLDGERILGRPFSAGGSGVDLLGDETDLPEPVSARVVATIERPDGSTQEASHLLFDRRLHAGDDGTLELRPSRFIERAPDVLLSVTTLLVSNGGANPRTLAYRQAQVLDFIAQVLIDEETSRSYAIADRLWPYAVAGEAMIMTSEQVLVPAAGGDGHGFVAEPRVYAHTIAADPAVPDDWVDVTDLMLDSVRVIPAAHGQPTAPSRLWYGTLQSALETERGLRSLAAIGLEAESISASLAMQPGEEEAYLAADLPAGVDPVMRADAAAGQVIVTGAEPEAALTWWAVDPLTGDTRAMLAPGFRGYRDVVEADADGPRFAIGANYAHRMAAGSRRAIRSLYGPGNPGRGLGYVPKNYAPPRSPGLPRNSRFRPPNIPETKLPEVRCGGNEYITVIGCVSRRAAVPLVFLGVAEAVAVEMLMYQLLEGVP